jgi:hypothetical protein
MIKKGDIFGGYIVLSDEVFKDDWGNVYYCCQCNNCGTRRKVLRYQLKRNKYGCVKCFQKIHKIYIKHKGRFFRINYSKNKYTRSTRLYAIYNTMKTRCYNQNNPSFKYYGGRGITICKSWKNNYSNFLKWAIDNGYKKKLQIGRIDNDKEYSPDNCRWVTNYSNKCGGRLITINEETKTLSQWADKMGISKQALHYRLSHGWSEDKAVLTPLNSLHK